MDRGSLPFPETLVSKDYIYIILKISTKEIYK